MSQTEGKMTREQIQIRMDKLHPDSIDYAIHDLALSALAHDASREGAEERFWLVEAVNEDGTVLSPPAYWQAGFIGSKVSGSVTANIHELCTRFQNAQTAAYVQCLLQNAGIKPERGKRWKIFGHILASRAASPAVEEPNAAPQGLATAPSTTNGPAAAAPDEVAEMVKRLRAFAGNEADWTLCRQAAALLERLGQRWIPAGERLPEESVSVLCRCWHTREGAWFTAVGHIRGEFADLPCWRAPGYNDDFGGIAGEVTHWMPLPLAPGASDD